LHSSRPMDFNKRREASSIAYWRISRSRIVLPHIFLEKSNQHRETRMSDLGLQPREVWKQLGRLPAEGRLGSSENTSNPRRCLLFVACLALFAYVPLVWHSEPSILILILKPIPVLDLTFNRFLSCVLTVLLLFVQCKTHHWR
jgi:hypothetical protein